MENFSDDKKGKIETCFGGFDVRLTARIIACLKVSFFSDITSPPFLPSVRRRTVERGGHYGERKRYGQGIKNEVPRYPLHTYHHPRSHHPFAVNDMQAKQSKVNLNKFFT